MADSRIPLGINQLDISGPLAARAQVQQNAITNQRNAGIDQMNQAQHAQSMQAGELQMQGQRTQNTAQSMELRRSALQRLAMDGVAFDNLVQQGDLQSAAVLGQQMKQVMTQAEIPTQEIDKLLSSFRNPEQLKAESAAMRRRVEASASQIFADVKDDKGNVVAQRRTDTGELSEAPKGMNPNAVDPSAQQQFGGQIQVQDANGNLSFATTKRNPQTGQVETVLSPIGEGMQMVGNYGETGAERTGRAVAEATGTTAAREEENRASGIIERATAAAESTATLRRGLQLLEMVETGGPEAIALSVKQSMGIEGADEGELSNSLGVAVLSQLRETFGAAFTENEGKRLERLQASFNKSPANNKRLLQQALRISENTARRGVNLAQARGQQETVDDLEDLLTFSLDIEGAPSQPAGGRFTIEEAN